MELPNRDAEGEGLSARHLLVILLARTTLNTAHRIIYPFLPSLARGLGISLTAASQLITLRLVAGLAAPVIGPMVERHSRRRVMEFALVLFAIGSLLLMTGGSWIAAAIALSLYGLAKVLYDPTVQAYVGDTVPYARRGRVMGLLELSWSSAWLLGVPATGFLIDRLGWRAPWAALCGLALLSLIATRLGLPPGRRAGDPGRQHKPIPALLQAWKSALRHRGVGSVLAASLLMTVAIETPFIVYGAWLETSFGLSLTTLGLASIVVGLAEAAAEMGTTLFTDTLGKRRSVLLGLLTLAGSLALLPWLADKGLVAALTGVVLMMLTFEFSIVSLLPLASELVPEARATLFSLNATAFSVGRIGGAILGGYLWQWGGSGILSNALAGALCALLAAGCIARGTAEIEIPGKR